MAVTMVTVEMVNLFGRLYKWQDMGCVILVLIVETRR